MASLDLLNPSLWFKKGTMIVKSKKSKTGKMLNTQGFVGVKLLPTFLARHKRSNLRSVGRKESIEYSSPEEKYHLKTMCVTIVSELHVET
jgi:hypothetical protein